MINKQYKNISENIEKLKIGDSIGVFSPSSPITYTCPKRFEKAKKYLQDKGFKIVEGNLTYRSGSIKERVEELNDLIRNPEIKCIMSTIGGMNSNSILLYIDYDEFRRNPKIIIGYSDVTAILLGIYEQTGINTYYGPALVASFGELPSFVDFTYKYFKEITMDDTKILYVLETPKYWTDEWINWETQDRSKEKRENQWITVYGGIVRGRVIGGNLNTILCKGRMKNTDLERLFTSRIKDQAILCTDSHKSYIQFTQNLGVELQQIKLGKHKEGIYHIQHINTFHSKLKKWMDRFNGVATKYLANYMYWFKWLEIFNTEKDTIKSKNLLVQSHTDTKLKDFRIREAIYI